MKKVFTYILPLVLVMMMFSCEDTESFSTNEALRLSFSEDTVSFDTVISTVMSSTKRVMIFNNNKEGLRVTSARLASGGASGFRINVDGRKGPVVNDIEVLKEDSIFMLVEVKTDVTNSVEPVVVRDSVLFTLESGVVQKLILEAQGQDAIILRAPRCKRGETMVFQSGMPYLIYDSLVVDSDATVNIEAGATLMFHSNASILVHGRLNINGEKGRMATLRGDRTDRMFTYLPYDRIDAQWGGIRLYGSSTNNVIRYADIHGGNYGIECDSTGTDKVKLTIENSIITNVSGFGLWAENCKIDARNSIISNARYDCVNVTGGEYDFVHCTIAQFYALGTYSEGNALRIANVKELDPCALTFHMDNSIVTGFAKDEVFASRFKGNNEVAKDEALFDLIFYNCLVTTDTIGAGEYFVDCIIDDINGDINRKKHFKNIDTHAFMFDYHLDSLSNARGKASNAYITALPNDMYGTERKAGNVDIGALQGK